MLPAFACGRGDLPESLLVQAYHPRMGKVVQETVLLEALGERPPASDAFDDFLQYAPVLKAQVLYRCGQLQSLLRNCDEAGSRKRTSTARSDSPVPGASWSSAARSSSRSSTSTCVTEHSR